jgi:hypothetical protein
MACAWLAAQPALACSGCRSAVLAQVLGEGLAGRLLVLVLPLLLLAAAAWYLESGRQWPWTATRGR